MTTNGGSDHASRWLRASCCFAKAQTSTRPSRELSARRCNRASRQDTNSNDQPDRPPVVQRHRLATYFGLTFAISWAIWLGLIIRSLGIQTLPGAVLNVVAIAGPSIAAVIMATVLGRPELRRLLAGFSPSRLSVRWTLVALLLPFAMMGAAIFVAIAAFDAPHPGVTFSVAGVVLAEFVRVLFLGGPLGRSSAGAASPCPGCSSAVTHWTPASSSD